MSKKVNGIYYGIPITHKQTDTPSSTSHTQTAPLTKIAPLSEDAAHMYDVVNMHVEFSSSHRGGAIPQKPVPRPQSKRNIDAYGVHNNTGHQRDEKQYVNDTSKHE